MKQLYNLEIKTDGDVVRVARRMVVLQEELNSLIAAIHGSDHPKAEELNVALRDECFFAAWPEHVISSHLTHPEKWETGDFGIRYKRGLR